MKLINFYIENWVNGYPIPNGLDSIDNIDFTDFGKVIQSVKNSNSENSFNEIVQQSRYIQNGLIEVFNYKDLKVIITNTILEDAINYYLIMPKTHFEHQYETFPKFNEILKKGLKLLFVNFHEAGEYTKFFKWVNENPYKDNIYTISPCYNLNEYVNTKHIFFPYLLYDLDHNFKKDNGKFSVCTKDEYVKELDKQLILSFNRNVKRDHRFYFFNFCKSENLIQNNKISFLEFPYEHVHGYNDYNIKELIDYKTDYLSHPKPNEIVLDIKTTDDDYDNLSHNWNNTAQLYSNTHLSIVTETKYFDWDIMLSEKTIRPIANFHPFILIGPRKSYEILKGLGFEIPNIINYDRIDNEQNPFMRLVKTFDEIRNVCKYFENNKKIPNLDIDMLEYNQNKLLNYNINDVFYELYFKLYNK